jgi:hypothetical protein
MSYLEKRKKDKFFMVSSFYDQPCNSPAPVKPSFFHRYNGLFFVKLKNSIKTAKNSNISTKINIH